MWRLSENLKISKKSFNGRELLREIAIDPRPQRLIKPKLPQLPQLAHISWPDSKENV